MGRASLLLAATAAAVLLAAGAAPTGTAASGCARYASSSGKDSAPGTAAQPFRSAKRLVSSLPAGTTGCLTGGSIFTERVVVTRGVALLGTGSRPPTIVGGVTFTSTAAGAALRNVTVRGFGAGRAAIVVRADRVVIADDTITGSAWVDRNTACVLLSGTRNAVVDGNRIETCTRATRRGLAASGVFVGSAYGAKVTDNLVAHTGGYGVVLGPNAQHTRVVHNLVDGNAISVLITGNAHTASSYNVVESNILSNAGGNNVRATWGGTPGKKNAVVANCVWQGFGGNFDAPSVQLAGNIVTSPRYVDRPRDFTVQAPACITKRPSVVGAHIPTMPLFRVTYHVRATASRVQVLRLGLANLVAGSRLSAVCVARCSGHWSGTAHGATATLTLVTGRWLPVGAAIEIRAARSGSAGAWARVRVTGLPNGLSIAHACLRPGGTIAVSCGSLG